MTRTAGTKHGFKVFDDFLWLLPCQEMTSCRELPFVHNGAKSAAQSKRQNDTELPGHNTYRPQMRGGIPSSRGAYARPNGTRSIHSPVRSRDTPDAEA